MGKALLDPVDIAWVAAVATALVAAFLPADGALDHYFKHWLPKKHRRYRAKVIALHLVATSVVAGGAASLGWRPAGNADLFKSAASGVAWALAAVALLRAEFPGFNAGEASPGFSLLRAFSTKVVDDLATDVSEAVRQALPASIDELRDTALRAKTRAYPPRADGTVGPDGAALAASIALLWTEATTGGDKSKMADAAFNLSEIVIQTVTANRLIRCW